ncbi:hypothetical protein OG196_00750 [Kitasatospora purpeofusca]|uniref:hypothetical protein n=1 Tax=Kitasatospora purpeofusca TaxID=67352 RepID=UPI002E137B5C|nr:hypothetical protein OG196_00750 [Kitasatospora purpeofusca]
MVKAIGTAGWGIATISGRLWTMASNYLAPDPATGFVHFDRQRLFVGSGGVQ